MNNKTILQEFNNRIEANNIALSDLRAVVQNLPIVGNVPDTPSNEYVQNGLVAWWEGEDELDALLHWNSRVGTDYIYQIYPSSPTSANSFGTIKTENAYTNNTQFCLATNEDYWKQGYTIEVVGKTYNQNNSQNNAGASLMTFDKQCSIMMQIWGDNNIFGVINQHPDADMPYLFTDCNNKRYKYAISLDVLPSRSMGGATEVSYALNDIGWYTRKTNVQSGGANGYHLLFLAYYSGSSGYRINGEISSIRIYNRKLTPVELQHNYEVDKQRFELDEYVM